MALLEIQDLTLAFAGLVAVNKLSFRVEERAIHGLIGPNGAGKSTVFNCISRLYEPQQGSIRFAGQELLTARPHEVLGWGIARTFQNVELFKSMTVLDNLLAGQHARLPTGLLAGMFRLPGHRRAEAAARARAEAVLEFLGLSHLAHEVVSGLPFGAMKMVELGRALVAEPRLLLLDEPAAGMNASETARLGQLVAEIRDRLGITVLLVEHDMTLVMRLCDRITVMDFGRKIAEGTPGEIQNNPDVIEAYLGEAQAIAGD